MSKMLNPQIIQAPLGIRKTINDAYRVDEVTHVKMIIEAATLPGAQQTQIRDNAMRLVEKVRAGRKSSTGIDSFLSEYSLSSEEGVALMCLAEALLRVPDKDTIDRLIKDKLTMGNWASHRGQSDSFFVNATTWALMLTGKVLSPEKATSNMSKTFMSLLNRTGESVIRAAVDKAMRIMSKQFVMGRNIQEALIRAKKKEAIGYRYSYDILGEAALTEKDANRYYEAYQQAIKTIGNAASRDANLYQRPGISIKLSALHPRYQEAYYDRVMAELTPKLLHLAQLAHEQGIGLTVDAEESERLDLSLDLIERVFKDDSLDGYHGFGLAVQSYQKRAFYVLDWVAELARSKKRRMTVRLIKGAYWDSEIKKSQMQGFKDFPVFTRKSFTDVSFQACARKLLTMTDVIYPQFATHNAYSVAMIMALVGDYRDFEFQCLHGMGNELYEQIVPVNKLGIPCRIYAPVGSHEDLLPYLVRRLLENGANTSFVNRIVDESAPIHTLVEDPVVKAKLLLDKIHLNIPLPKDIFKPARENSKGLDLSDRAVLSHLQAHYETMDLDNWSASPVLKDKKSEGIAQSVMCPQNPACVIGQVIEACDEDVDWALSKAQDAQRSWANVPVKNRADIIRKVAHLLEKNHEKIFAMLSLEAGKTWSDCIGELREAVDFCYYYAHQAEILQSSPQQLLGYTGEINELSLHPRGTILCISPWNFPLAIFLGQVVSALVTGNAVIAKPAQQTPLIAAFAVELLLEAGVPVGVIQLLPGSGRVGARCVADERIKAVMFTGSTQTAKLINQTLAARDGDIIPLIAETGGQNAMIVDSSALLEQVTLDAIQSAFGSAGQRCSALRVLYIQEDVYPRMKSLLEGAMAELNMGCPSLLTTDVGPVIDKAAMAMLNAHVTALSKTHEIIYQCKFDNQTDGYFVPPTLIRLDSISTLTKEVFGPVLHVITYKRDALDNVINDINSTGFGLTLGIHSRINETAMYIKDHVKAGNCYVNRNMVGAVVGLQPFGGEGLSGTGPKAGGPHYLPRLCVERTLTIDTTAAGGNASLMSLPEEV